MDTLVELQEMWDRRLEGIDMAKYRIQLTATDVYQINSTPYRFGPKPSEFEKPRIDGMLRMKVV